MKIQKTLPPTAAPIGWKDLWYGLAAWIGSGDALRRREEEFRTDFHVKHVWFTSSGKAALYLILCALKGLYPERDQVVIPAYTCFSVPSAIVKAGLHVAPCDIDQGTFDFNRVELSKTLNERTLCVIPGHLFGIPADMDFIRDICKKRGIVVLEDAAQSMGGTYKGRKLGTIGDVSFFSFGRGKNITCGSGGVILTDAEDIAQAIGKEHAAMLAPTLCEDFVEFIKLISLVVLIRPHWYWLPAGLPFLRLGETVFYKDFPVQKLGRLKAGILQRWRERLQESNSIRTANARDICRGATWPSAIEVDGEVVLLRLPMLLGDTKGRDALVSLGQASGLGISRMYPAPVNEIDEIKDQMVDMAFPSAKAVAQRLVNIPTHHLLSTNDKERIRELLSRTVCSVMEEVS